MLSSYVSHLQSQMVTKEFWVPTAQSRKITCQIVTFCGKMTITHNIKNSIKKNNGWGIFHPLCSTMGTMAPQRLQQPATATSSWAATLPFTPIEPASIGIGYATYVFAAAGFVKSKYRVVRLIYEFVLYNSSQLSFYYVNRIWSASHNIINVSNLG